MENQESPAIREQVAFIGTPEALGELYASLAAAQGEFAPIVKDSTAQVQMKAGGSYKFEYAGLDVVIAATQPALSKHGLAFMQLLTEFSVMTVLAKRSARIESIINFSPVGSPQEFGSKVTYLKRYARLSILSVFPQDEDDDANVATGNTATITRATPPAVKPVDPPNPNGLQQSTKDAIKSLSAAIGFKNSELEEFSVNHGCGKLSELNQAKGEALVKLLEAQKAGGS